MVMTATAFQIPHTAEISTRNPFLLDTRSIGAGTGVAINQSPITLTELAAVELAELRFPKLNYSFEAPVMDLSPGPSPETKVLKIGIAEEATLELLLTMKLGGIDSEIILENPTPTVHTAFMLTTLMLMLALDGELALQLAPGHFSASYHISTPLNLVAEVFPLRKIAYELMVIERAYGTSFPITAPYNFIPKDLITFVYQAITQKEFVWQFPQTAFRFQATENAKNFLQNARQPFNREFGVGHFEVELQGKKLDLGEHKVKVENATITNAEEITKELELLDGHDLPVYVYAPSGTATFHFLQTPTLPSPFDQLTQEFIGLERQLVDLFFDSVNQLAAASIDEETALEQEQLLNELAFDFSEDDDTTSASIN